MEGAEDAEDDVETEATATVGESPPEAASDEEPQVPEAKTPPITVKADAETTPGHEDDEVDSLLEVFKEVQLSDNPISLLSRDLADTDVYSLLEEMRWIAKRVKEASTD